ncbi:TAXI family TRAP transporter solute-binding subunit [Lutispora sp.]|uniref:TAXI family TRAP transporter solute-binding subunit n=1 Tax=Lutispora sp. TaxID=2828727 RepID=UPI00356AC56B
MKNRFTKVTSLIIAIIMVMSLITACSGGGQEKAPNEGSQQSGEFKEPDKLNVTIVGGSIGGAWAAIGEGVGEVIRRSYAGSNTAYEVGQEAANLALVSAGKVQLGIAHTGLIKMASEGQAPFNRKMENLRALTVLYGEAAEHFLIKADTGITSFEDLKNKKYPLKVNFNTADSFMEIVGKKCLEANGITYEDLKSWGGAVDFMSMGNSIDLMRDGKLEAYSNVIQVPSSHIVDASTNLKLNLLPMTDEAIEKVNAELGTYKTTISKEKYSFLNEDVPTVAATVVLFASTDLTDGEAYAIVKAIDENMDYFKGIHASLGDLTLEKMTEVAPVPLHPGAEKYYKEKGVL